jgi:GGDEF domain-containing protein
LLYEGNKIHVGISTGIVSNSGGNADFDAILRKADMAMYRAKQAGRHGYAFASGKRPTAGSQP